MIRNIKYFWVYLLSALIAFICITTVEAEDAICHPSKYIPSMVEFTKHKKPYDDPRPVLSEYGVKDILPKDMYEKLTYDVSTMKDSWSSAVGFKAPDLVGKIAPEIKPGKYTYKNIEKYPEFKNLLLPILLDRIKPAGPPHAGNVQTFEIIPTRQYYYHFPVAEATIKNEGKTKLDDKGYIVWNTWESGIPFPKPDGPFKAQQIMANYERRYVSYGMNHYTMGQQIGINKKLEIDFRGTLKVRHTAYSGRVLSPPYGYLDDRAKKQCEMKGLSMMYTEPRDIAGMCQSLTIFQDAYKTDRILMYIPSLRRIRKMSSTDTQDPLMGQDLIYDDMEGLMQKLRPDVYPYQVEIIAEREYLVVSNSIDGAEYMSSEKWEMKNVRLERRPIYVVQMTQLDPNYIYGKRVFYVDKETFLIYVAANYDQKGKLYRTQEMSYGFEPDMGALSFFGGLTLQKDMIDLHSSYVQWLSIPAFWNRKDMSIEVAVKRSK